MPHKVLSQLVDDVPRACTQNRVVHASRLKTFENTFEFLRVGIRKKNGLIDGPIDGRKDGRRSDRSK